MMHSGKSIPLTEADGFQIEDFILRWRRARISALLECVDRGSLSDGPQNENELLEKVPQAKHDELLRRVFDYSRSLGRGAVVHFGLVWEVSDIVTILMRSGSSCVAGHWSSTRSTTKMDEASPVVLRRKGCDLAARLGSIVCDYWREALDGLVMGVGENERFARHASRGHGDEECVDVLFVESSPKSGSPRWGKVPDYMEGALTQVRNRLLGMKVTVVLDGYSEKTLYYKLENTEGPLCGAGGRLLHESFARDVKRLFPEIQLQDTGPLAVYGSGT